MRKRKDGVKSEVKKEREATSMTVMKKGYRGIMIVLFEIAVEDIPVEKHGTIPSKDDLKKMLVDEVVKVKSGRLENIADGIIIDVDNIEKDMLEYTEVW